MTTNHETILDVTGMTCRSCVRHIDQALRELDGIQGVEVQLREGTVLVRHDPRVATVRHLVAALREAGYEAKLSGAAAA